MTTQDTVAKRPPPTRPSNRTPRRTPDRAPDPLPDLPSGDGHAGHEPPELGPPPSERRTFQSRRPHKTPWADLKAQYTATLMAGFVLALALLIGLMSVDWRAESSGELVALQQQEIVEMQEVMQTEQVERPPAPPRPAAPVEVPNDQVIEDEPLNLDASLDLNASLDVPTAPPPPAEEAPEEESYDDEEVFVAVEKKPELIGGMAAINDKIRYPTAARQAGVQGQVIVQFIVDEEGNVTDPTVLRSPHSMLSDEALRVIQLVKFTPGQQRNRTVKVQMALPITFRLQNRGFR